MDVGFTGTQEGMTKDQKETLANVLSALVGGQVFHHGDCIGADAQAASIAQQFGYFIKSHPPIQNKKRAFFESDDEAEPKEYLERNHDIVDACKLLIATPKGFNEELRSGTWATIRYAMEQNITRGFHYPVLIIYPNGTLEIV